MSCTTKALSWGNPPGFESLSCHFFCQSNLVIRARETLHMSSINPSILKFVFVHTGPIVGGVSKGLPLPTHLSSPPPGNGWVTCATPLLLSRTTSINMLFGQGSTGEARRCLSPDSFSSTFLFLAHILVIRRLLFFADEPPLPFFFCPPQNAYISLLAPFQR